MPKGSAGVPVLQLETMNKLISKLDLAPNLFFANLFPETRYASDSIKWEIEYGSAGLAPFVAPGSVAPKIGLDGVGEGSAKAAYVKEAMFFDEVFLNNIRQVGTYEEYQTSERSLAKGLNKLRRRVDRRREWMSAKAIIDGSFAYTAVGGTKIAVSYGIPATHQITLATDDKWLAGSTKDIMGDVLAAKQILADDAGVVANYVMVNTALLRLLMTDSGIQGLLHKSTFGDGDLFRDPARVVGELLGVGTLMVFDEFSEFEQTLTANVVGASTTTVSVDDATNIEVGSVARFYDTSQNNVWEDATVTAVDIAASTFTIAVTTLSFKANEDIVRFRSKFLGDSEFLMFSDKNADGEPIAESMLAPFGLGRHYGTYVDTNEEFDPEGITLRIQHKSLPVIYHPDCIFKYTVG